MQANVCMYMYICLCVYLHMHTHEPTKDGALKTVDANICGYHCIHSIHPRIPG